MKTYMRAEMQGRDLVVTTGQGEERVCDGVLVDVTVTQPSDGEVHVHWHVGRKRADLPHTVMAERYFETCWAEDDEAQVRCLGCGLTFVTNAYGDHVQYCAARQTLLPVCPGCGRTEAKEATPDAQAN